MSPRTIVWILLAGVLAFPFAASGKYLLLFSALSLASIGLTIGIWVYVIHCEVTEARLTGVLNRTRPLSLLGGLQLVSQTAIFLINTLVSHSIPHIHDEAAYWFQAKIFATFHLYLTPHQLAANFPLPWVESTTGKWHAVFPFGWPFFLSFFMVLGRPELANMLFSFGVLVVFHKILQRFPMTEIYRKVALIVLATSPFFLLIGAGYMSHMSHLFFFLAGLYFFTKFLDGHNYRPLALCGFLMGVAFLIRPMETLIFLVSATALFVVLLVRRLLKLRKAVLALATLVVCVAPFLAIQLFTNAILTGSPQRLPSDQMFDRLSPGSNRLGFGKTGFIWSDVDRAFPDGHSAIKAWYNTYYNLKHLDAYATGAPVFLFLVLAFFVLRAEFLVSEFYKMLIALIVAAYGLYWYHGIIGAGPRFLFSLLPLMVFAYVNAAERIDRLLAGRHHEKIVNVLCAASAMAILVVTPLICRFRIHNEGDITDKYSVLATQLPPSSLVVIERENRWLYSAAMMLNDVPVDQSSRLFVYAREPDDFARIMDYYRGRYRNVYRYDAASRRLVRMSASETLLDHRLTTVGREDTPDGERPVVSQDLGGHLKSGH